MHTADVLLEETLEDDLRFIVDTILNEGGDVATGISQTYSESSDEDTKRPPFIILSLEQKLG